MQIIPITLRPLLPPQDDLYAAATASTLELQDGDVVCVSSKVIAIHEGRCLPGDTTDKRALCDAQADLTIPRPYWGTPLSVVHNTFLGTAGVDESNGNGYLIQLPEDPFASARALHTHWCAQFGITRLGVVVTDSRSLPFRYGASGVALGWWGIAPLQSHIGKADIFGRTIRYERSNIVDGIAAAANVVMGETDECQPIVVVRAVPNLIFKPGNTKDELFSTFKDDTFRVLYEKWLD